MGSSPSPPQPLTLEPSPAIDRFGYRVYVSFCLRQPTLTTNNISNWIECYDLSNHAWSYVSPIPGITESYVLKGFAMVSLRDSIYIIGGRLCYKEMVRELADLVDVKVEVLSTVLRYNVRTDQWSTCAPLQTPRSDFACTVCNDKIYVAGGQSTSSNARGISSAEVYDASLDEWSSLPSMSTLRYKCAGVTWNGKIHVISGFAERLDSDRPSPFPGLGERSSAEVYDPETGRWELRAKMWQLDVPPNQILALDDGRLYSSGDCLKAWKGHIEAYDPGFNMWNVVPGSQQATRSPAVHPLDVADGAWSPPIHPLNVADGTWPPIQPMYVTVAPIETRLYFLVGYRTSGHSPRTTTMVHMFDTFADANYWRSFGLVEEDGEKEFCSHCCVIQLS
ncbi:hypothetical protein BT93_D0457 [Corymbia citriodora subsp. variegata]|nr:hypothetical protein BT93_D0457 [Corymbia citriodora subsp. variegata]